MRNLKKWAVPVLLVFLMTLAGSVFTGAASAEAAAPKQYTVMYYVCGSDLERDNGQASSELAAILSSRFNTDAINSIGLLGGTPRWAAGQFDPGVLTVVNVSGRRPRTVDTMPLAPMDDPATLTAFLDYCYDNYPAEHYILVISDHGGGPLRGCCMDLLSSGIMGSMALKQAFADSRLVQSGLDIVAFDCCLMGSAEIANIISPYAQYMVATEDSMYGIGFDWLSGLENDATVLDTAVRIAESTYRKNKETIQRQHASELNSVSVIDLKKMPAVVQAMDAFFSGESVSVDKDRFSALSNHRSESVSFGVIESGGYSAYDLVDAGSLITEFGKQGAAGSDELLAAFREAVPYHAADVDGCVGITLYHPYSNKKQAESSMEVYAGLGFSPSYVDYVIRYTAIMTGQPLAKWENLLTNVVAASKDIRTRFFLELTDEQIAHLGAASMKVFQKQGDGSFRFAFVTDDVSLNAEKKQITGEYNSVALYAVDAEGNPLSPALPYSLTPAGGVMIPASLTLQSEDGPVVHEAMISCEVQGKDLLPGSVLVKDEMVGGWTSGFRTVFTDYSDISVSLVSRSEVRDENGTLLPFDEWTAVTEETWTLPVDGSWSFRFLDNTLDSSSLYVSFEVQDTQSNRYAGDLYALAGEHIIGTFSVTYDDSGLVLINDLTLTVDENQLHIAAEVTSLYDGEAVISAADLAINGKDTGLPKAEAFGKGDNWGLLKDEKQPLDIYVPMELLSGADSVTEMTFSLSSEDPVTGEVFGSVPVNASGLLELK